MPRYTIDRFEGAEWAVLENESGKTFNIPRRWLPENAREGDVLDVTQQPATDAHLLRFTVDSYGRKERLEEATRRRDQLPRGPKGDIKL